MKKIFKNLDVYSIKNYLGPIKDKEKIIECLKINCQMNFDPSDANDFMITADYNDFFDNFYIKIINDFGKIFNFTLSDDNSECLYCYLSDKNNHVESWHNHLNTSTFVITYYLNIPKNETSIDFYSENCDEVFTYKPTTDEVLIFPNYMYHKPNRCYHDGYRISINCGIMCQESSKELFSRIKKRNFFKSIFNFFKN